VLHADETGIRILGKTEWLHVISNADLTYLWASDHRGRAAINEMQVLNFYTGTLIHDCLASYFALNCAHGLCNAHLMRELNFFSEVKEHKWAARMQALLMQALNAPETTSERAGNSAIAASSPRPMRSTLTCRQLVTDESVDERPNHPSTISLLDSRNTKTRYCASSSSYTCHSPTTKPNATYAWLKSNKRSLAHLEPGRARYALPEYAPTSQPHKNEGDPFMTPLIRRSWATLCSANQIIIHEFSVKRPE